MRPLNVHLVSLGCPKNLVDSEFLLGRIGERGYQITPYPELADVLMVNTCSFIESAKQESVDHILELANYKEDDPGKKIVVAGCLGQRYPDEIAAEIPEIDLVVGMSEYPKIAEILDDLVDSERRTDRLHVKPPSHPAYSEASRLRLTAPHSAYLRTSEGCDNPCTFCAIPSFRGRFRSKSVELVVEEATELVQSGAREINLISQDLTSYGYDHDGKFRLPELLAALDDVEGLDWIRLLYAYPAKFSDSMIDAIAELDSVVPYIDMPIQHIHDKTLRRMGRRMGEADTKALFRRMRERIPGLTLRTTFIVGFPGETDEEFETLLRFVEEERIERVGVFPYSDEDGTPATRIQGKVPAEIAEDRLDRLMTAQQRVAFEWNARRVGERTRLIVDGREPENEDGSRGRLVCRSAAEAPDIDAQIFVDDPAGEVPAGSFIDGTIVRVEDYDLVAERVGAPDLPSRPMAAPSAREG